MMRLSIRIIPRTLHFHQPAGTSRGVYTTHRVWYVEVTSPDFPGSKGLGECAPLVQLSCDDLPDYEARLQSICAEVERTGTIDREALRDYPSMLFGLETALRQLQCGKRLWDTPFSRGEEGIRINGLIWMGTYEEMMARLKEKMDAGFRCIKLKIGAIDFEKELKLLSAVRARYSDREVELRVDANGAFTPEEAPEKLHALSAFHLHSIEQPIHAGQWEAMAHLTEVSPIPIALDEELIACRSLEDKRRMLRTVRPRFIVIKPTLHGGLAGAQEWISEAEKLGIGWWITSALESNVGLNAIAQWTATFRNPMPQGLGTGMLFTDNVPMPLEIRGERLWYNPS